MGYKVAVIIVTFNAKNFIDNCLKSLQGQAFSDTWSIYIVDNNSTDDTVEFIQKNYPETTLIKNEKNEGFGAANNVGMLKAREEGFKYLVLLNQDTIVEENFLQSGVNFLDSNKNIGAAAPTILYKNTNRIWWIGSKLFRGADIITKPTLKVGLHISKGINCKENNIEQVFYDTDWVTGCAMFIRKEIIIELNGFDDAYFMYGEDVDLSLRISNFGYDLAHFQGTIVYHDVPYPEKLYINYTLVKKMFRMMVSSLKIIKRHYSQIEKLYYFLNILFYPIIRLLKLFKNVL